MGAAAIPSSESTAWLWKARLPGLLADAGYMSAICLATLVSFDITAAFGVVPADQHHDALRSALSMSVYSTIHLFPYVPICALAVRLAPAAGLGRYVCFSIV